MSTEDLLKANFDAMTAGFFGTTVGYKSLSGRPESSIPWSDINAIVDDSPEILGATGDRGRSPIVVAISKSDLASVSEGVDKVKYNTKTYVVQKVIESRAGGWELYCL